MTYDTIEDGESTPLHEGGYSKDAPSMKNKHTSAFIVCALMVGTAVAVSALLLMAGPSKMMTMNNKSSNIDGMVVVSSATSRLSNDEDPCVVATGTFSGLSCKDSQGHCAGPGESFRTHLAMNHYETCYVSQNGYCWSRSHTFTICELTSYPRCDPKGYNDGNKHYDEKGIWHVLAPYLDGSCGNPCKEFLYG